MRDTLNHSRLQTRLATFSEFGGESIVEVRNGVPHYINEFWTAGQRQGHRLHEVSYRACFKPQLPAFFIDLLTEPGDVVYDPFMGRGTTPIEANLKGRVAFGNDANPLSILLTEPRLNTPTLGQVRERLAEIPWKSFDDFEHDELLPFYHPDTLAMIEGLRSWMIERSNNNLLDNTDKWIRMVAINRLTGHSPGFFSVYTMPPNQAVSIETQVKINAKRNQSPTRREVPDIILKKSKSLLSQGGASTDSYKLLTKKSHETNEIPDASVSLTVTSPPFLDIVQYEADNWLRCWFAGIEVEKVGISSHKKVEDWQDFTHQTLRELVRITKPGGHIAYEVGEVRNKTVFLEEHVLEASSGLAIEPEAVMINQQDFTKTSNCWGVGNNAAGTNTNRIVIFRRT
ncbi:DNA methyltransferase [Pseudothioclava arenosa]|nr:DNA methyltransferase [Pseudothioclava arenosa]